MLNMLWIVQKRAVEMSVEDDCAPNLVPEEPPKSLGINR